jgi:hypothetical protein
MILDQVTDTEMQAARLLVGATIVAFLAASACRQHARTIRVVVLCIYIFGVLAFTIHAFT